MFGSRSISGLNQQSIDRWALCTLAISLVALLSSGCGRGNLIQQRLYLNNHTAELNRPVSSDETLVQFEVSSGMPARAIGQALQEANLISDERLFEAYVRVNGVSNRLAAGIFLLSPSMTIPEIAEMLQNSGATSVRMTFPEGWRIGQMVDHIRSSGLLDESQLAAYENQVTSGVLSDVHSNDYPFLATRPANMGLEGYLFPDTYQIPLNTPTAAAILSRQLATFQSKVMPLYQEAIETSATEMDLYTVLIIASIVEREAVIADERPAIAGVYLNRLRQGMKLEADPTVQYAMGYQPDTEQWWKTPVFLEEYSSVLSPYNTYLYAGLPPGPIANPGLSSIRAVLYPEEHDYLYFVALPNENGRHVFAQTFEEHQRNVDNYLRGG